MSVPPEVAAILRGADDGRVASCQAAVRALGALDVQWRARARVRVLRNCTLDGLDAPLRLAGYRLGVAIEVEQAPFGTYAQEILDPSSELSGGPYDVVVLGLWLDELSLAFAPTGELEAGRAIEHVEGLVARLLDRTAGRVALCTFVAPLHRAMTPRDRVALARVDLAVLALAERYDRVWVTDVRGIVERLGEAAAIDRRGSLMHRAPMRPELLTAWAHELAHRIVGASGGQRKVLALDCDGTLWGGVLGEDGQAGIQLDPEQYPGNAFVAFQRQVLALQAAGVMVVLVSKNEDADVMRVLAEHPHCLLRPEHLAGRRVGWGRKDEALVSLARELNVGVDSFVFVDDSSYECALVRESLPEVDVRQVPANAFALPALLRDAASLFCLGAATREDLSRTSAMAAEKLRAEAASAATDLASFLGSLGIVADIGEPDASVLPRLVQLTQRTNQFNATTRRYSLEQVTRMVSDDDSLVLGMRASDRFGDYGVIGLGIAVRDGGEVRLDTFLLSCRALGRRLEDALLLELLRGVAARWGPLPVRAEYVATPKNGQLARFFDGRGFACVEADETRRAYAATSEALAAEPPPFVEVRRGRLR